jgi:molecular chaperone DnaK (HSP70)
MRSYPLPYLLGLDVGSATTWAAICRRAPGPDGWGPPEPVATDSPPAVPGLFRRCGDDVPVYCDNLLITPQALVVEQARAAADQIWAREGDGPERIAVAHPSAWGPARVGMVRAAFADAGMSDVVLVGRACAVVRRHLATGRPVPAGRPVAVCRIGRASVEFSLILPHEPGCLELLGVSSTDDFGGADLAESGAPVMAVVLEVARRAARAARVGLGELAAVLPAGGGAAHPLVIGALADAIPAPVIREDDPWLTVARGTALSLRPPAPPLPVAAEALVVPTELLPITDSRLGLSELGPGEMPARPPVRVPASTQILVGDR